MIFSLATFNYNISKKLNSNFYQVIKLVFFIACCVLLTLRFPDLKFDILKYSDFGFISLSLVLLLLSTLNLFIETEIWYKLIQNSKSRRKVFEVVCKSYNWALFSNNFIGSILAKRKLFEKDELKNNLYSNISFGLYQSYASVALNLIVLFIILSIGKLDLIPYLTFSNEQLSIFSLALFLVLLIPAGLILKNLRVLLFAVLRSLIFLLQFTLLILFFYPNDIALSIFILASFYTIKSFIPIFDLFGGIGTREFTLLFLFGFFGLETGNIVFAAFTIWIVNYLFPNLIGLTYRVNYKKWISLLS